jgi:magnesium transporter
MFIELEAAMRIVVYEGQTVTDHKVLDWERWFGSDQYIVWVDMMGPNIEDARLLREQFRFHPIAIEQVLDHKQRPKVEEFNDHLFTIMNSAHVDGQDIYFRELDIFVKENVVVTIHRFPEPSIDHARRKVHETCEAKGITVGYLLYTVIQIIVDSYFPVLDQLEQQLDRLEDEVMVKPSQDKLTRLFNLKRTVAEIWRISAQQRDMFSVLMRDESPYINQTTLRYYLRDVYDHLLRIYDNASAIRDNVSSAVDLFFSAQSQQLNRFVNRLTLVTIATGILAVITGFYGMNFELTWPPFEADWGVLFVVTLIGAVLLVLLLVLRRQRQL